MGKDWPAVSRNLRNARKKWGQFSSLLKREGASSRVSGLFYKAVVMSTLLYSCETWVITQPILRALEGFHHRIVRSISKMSIRYIPDRDYWERPSIEAALSRAGCYPIQHYVDRRRQYLVRYAKDLPLLQECLAIGGNASRQHYW